MNQLKSLLIIFAACLMVGCSSFSITFDYDLTADFTKLKTYKWLQPKKNNKNDALLPQTLLRKKIIIATEEVLATKGYEKIESGEPDFFVAAHTDVIEKMNVTDWGYSYGSWYGQYGRYSGRNIDINYFNQATLSIAIVETEKNELIWRGTATGIVNNHRTPEKRTARTLELIQNILKDFPPGK